jgi:hypothetical protein
LARVVYRRRRSAETLKWYEIAIGAAILLSVSALNFVPQANSRNMTITGQTDQTMPVPAMGDDAPGRNTANAPLCSKRQQFFAMFSARPAHAGSNADFAGSGPPLGSDC